MRWITEAVFTVFGEYGSWLPGYLGHPGVWTFVYEEHEQANGFAMLGVLDPEDDGTRAADLLAIAVRPGCQDRGIGRSLLARVVDKAMTLKGILGVHEVRLTVADTNERARHLFGEFGFEPIPGDHGLYEKGQRALRLRLRL